MTEIYPVVGNMREHFDRAFSAIASNPDWPNPIAFERVDENYDRMPEILIVPENIALQTFCSMSGGNSKIKVELEKRFDSLDVIASRVIYETRKDSGSVAIQRNVLLIENDHLYRNMPRCGSSAAVLGLKMERPSSREVFVEANEKFTAVYAKKLAQLALATE